MSYRIRFTPAVTDDKPSQEVSISKNQSRKLPMKSVVMKFTKSNLSLKGTVS